MVVDGGGYVVVYKYHKNFQVQLRKQNTTNCITANAISTKCLGGPPVGIAGTTPARLFNTK